MSTHVDIPKTAVETLVESLTELQRRLDPSSGGNYCATCDVPDISVNGEFSHKLADARAAVQQGRLIDAAEAAKEVVTGLYQVIQNASGAADDPELINIYFERLFFPVLLFVLKKFSFSAYIIAVVLLHMEERGQEWLSQTHFGDRIGFLFSRIIARSIGHVMGQKPADEEEVLEPQYEWPVLATDLMGMAALMYHLKGEHRPYYDYWFGYGFDPANPAAPTTSELVASRSLSFWWEDHPEAKVVQQSYKVSPPLPASPARLGVTLVPMFQGDGARAVFPLLHLGFTGKIRLGDWELELTRAETNAVGGDIEAKLTRAGGGNWFSIGNASQEGKPNAYLAVKGVEIAGKAKYDLNDFSKAYANVALRFRKVKFSIGNPGGSKLLERALPEGLSGEFDLGLIADARKESIYFEGGIGMDVYAPLEWSASVRGLGLEIPHVRVRLKADKKENSTALSAEAALGVRLRLGPLKVFTDGLGIGWSMTRSRDKDGNMGPFTSDWKMTEPTSIGLSIQTSKVKGEGFISRDEANDRWMGALGLEFKSIKLAGVVMTEGRSVMAAVWATKLNFDTPIGVFDGLGLIVATDRRGDQQAFLDGLKDGVLDAVLFPKDPVLNAPTILATMSSLMPRADGFTIIGAMLQWVYPDRVSRLFVVEAAILMEFEGSNLRRIYLLGQGSVRLSRLPERLFSINVEMFGVIDLDKGEFFVKLSLRNSKIAGGDLTGDGLIYYGKDGGILSLGGFNPRFTPPPGLPPLSRLTANLVNTEHVKLVFTAYVALTTCSFQIGGSVYVWAGAYGFSIEGFLKADLLARFDGEFFLDVQFSVALKRGSRVLASIYFEGTFSGVSTWCLSGKAKFSVLFLSVTIPVSFKLGGSAPATFETADATSALKQALEAQESWTPVQRQSDFAVRDVPRTGVWIAANESLRVSQRAVPFGQNITRLGAAPLAGPQEFHVENVLLGGQQRTWDPVNAEFAPGLFQDVDLEAAVRAPQFEQMQSGLEIATQDLALGSPIDSLGEFEEQVVDELSTPLTLPSATAAMIAALDSVAAPESSYYRVPTQPIRVEERRYLVTYNTLKPADDLDPDTLRKGLTFTQSLEIKRARPTLLQVVRRYEVNS